MNEQGQLRHWELAVATDAGDQFWVKVFVVAVLSLMVLIPLLILGFMVLFGDDISEFSRMLNGG